MGDDVEMMLSWHVRNGPDILDKLFFALIYPDESGRKNTHEEATSI